MAIQFTPHITPQGGGITPVVSPTPEHKSVVESTNLTVLENGVPSLDGVEMDMVGELTSDRIDELVKLAFNAVPPPWTAPQE